MAQCTMTPETGGEQWGDGGTAGSVGGAVGAVGATHPRHLPAPAQLRGRDLAQVAAAV